MRPENADIAAPPLSPRAERKLAQVIKGARSVLIAKGFEGASVDDIAREAGISKATMYRYFPDKSALFAAVMNQECSRQIAASSDFSACRDRPIGLVLHDFGIRHLEFALSDAALDGFRTAVAESVRFPQMARDFHLGGVSRAQETLVPIVEAGVARNEIEVDDPKAAALTFLDLCRGDLMYRRLFGVEETTSAEEIAAHACNAVTAFMKIYGVKS